MDFDSFMNKMDSVLSTAQPIRGEVPYSPEPSIRNMPDKQVWELLEEEVGSDLVHKVNHTEQEIEQLDKAIEKIRSLGQMSSKDYYFFESYYNL